MDPLQEIQKLYGANQANTKSFKDMLRERRDFVQSAENSMGSLVQGQLDNGSNGVLVNPVLAKQDASDFYTTNQNATTGLIEQMGQQENRGIDILKTLAEMGLRQKELSLKERELNMPDLKALVEGETSLRKEFMDETAKQKFPEVRAAYEKIKNSGDSAAGQMGLVFGYMKLLDPGSTVREGEYANAENTRGVPEAVRNNYNKLVEGKKLSTKQVLGFKSEATKIYNQYAKRQSELNLQYDKLAQDYGVDNKRVTGAIGRTPQEPLPQMPQGMTEGQEQGGIMGFLSKLLMPQYGLPQAKQAVSTGNKKYIIEGVE